MNRTHHVYMTALGLAGLLVITTMQTAEAKVKKCKKDAQKGAICLMQVEDLHPTQFSVGSIAVDCKSAKIEKKYEKKKLDKYLSAEKRLVPAAIGPDGGFYITDHHHLSTAVYRAKSGDWSGKKQDVYVQVLDNYTGTGVSMHEFWSIMEMQKNVWPYDENGKKVKNYEEKLPKMDVGDLKDNPYRSLSRWTRESCGYVKAGKDQCTPLETIDGAPTAPYFMEFYWARFLRDQIKKDNDQLNSPKKATKQYKKAIAATLDLDKTSKFFKSQGLDAKNYGQNTEGNHYHLEFSKKGCESWYLNGKQDN